MSVQCSLSLKQFSGDLGLYQAAGKAEEKVWSAKGMHISQGVLHAFVCMLQALSEGGRKDTITKVFGINIIPDSVL